MHTIQKMYCSAVGGDTTLQISFSTAGQVQHGSGGAVLPGAGDPYKSSGFLSQRLVIEFPKLSNFLLFINTLTYLL